MSGVALRYRAFADEQGSRWTDSWLASLRAVQAASVRTQSIIDSADGQTQYDSFWMTKTAYTSQSDTLQRFG